MVHDTNGKFEFSRQKISQFFKMFTTFDDTHKAKIVFVSEVQVS